MSLMCDVAYQRQKSSLHFGGFKVQAAFLGCRVGIYALAISGCLGHRTRGQRVPTLRLLAGVCGAVMHAVGHAGYACYRSKFGRLGIVGSASVIAIRFRLEIRRVASAAINWLRINRFKNSLFEKFGSLYLFLT